MDVNAATLNVSRDVSISAGELTPLDIGAVMNVTRDFLLSGFLAIQKPTNVVIKRFDCFIMPRFENWSSRKFGNICLNGKTRAKIQLGLVNIGCFARISRLRIANFNGSNSTLGDSLHWQIEFPAELDCFPIPKQ